MSDPVSGPLTMAAAAALLEASAHALNAESTALGPLARTRPAADEWCANEVIGHLLEAEGRAFAGRIRLILSAAADEPEPELATWDQPTVAAGRRDDLRETEELLAELADLRTESLVLVRSLRPVDLARTGRHPHVGSLAVGDIVHEWVHHDREHLKQLLDVSRSFAWAGMGAARRFTEPEV
jgi:hypothetical protein